MLQIENLCKSYGAVAVTQDVDLRVQAGERRVLLGPNGAGKTTLLNLISGDIQPDAGSIWLDGIEISKHSIDKRARAGLGRSFQKNNLFTSLTVFENFELAVMPFILDQKNRTASINKTAGQVGLLDRLSDTVSILPYGQRRQLEIGLALINQPKLLLLDEPTSGVSPDQTAAFEKLVQGLSRDISLLIIEHDMDLAFSIADTVTVLDQGRVVFDVTPEAAKSSKALRDLYLGEDITDA